MTEIRRRLEKTCTERSHKMGKDKKSICKWDKDEIKDDLKKLMDIVTPPKFICLKCGRVAKKSDYLCKPEEM